MDSEYLRGNCSLFRDGLFHATHFKLRCMIVDVVHKHFDRDGPVTVPVTLTSNNTQHIQSSIAIVEYTVGYDGPVLPSEGDVCW